MVPRDTPVKTVQFLASDSPRDCIGEIVNLLVWGEADLWMTFKLGGKPGGPAFGCANPDKVNVLHTRHYLTLSFGKYTPSRNVWLQAP